MFLLASKLLWLLAEPINLLIVGAVAGALAMRRYPVGGRRLALACAIGLLSGRSRSDRTIAVAAARAALPPPPAEMKPPYGVIVLGGAIDDALSSARGQVVVGDAGSRVTEAVALARRFPEARIVYTGGDPQPFGGAPTSPRPISAKIFSSPWASIPRAIAVEPASRNTDENARFSAAMLQPKPDQSWLLVTSAYHMPRAMGLFRKAGFNVIAYPVDYRTFGDATRRARQRRPPERTQCCSISPCTNGRASSPIASPARSTNAFPAPVTPTPNGARQAGRRRENRGDRPACPCDR